MHTHENPLIAAAHENGCGCGAATTTAQAIGGWLHPGSISSTVCTSAPHFPSISHHGGNVCGRQWHMKILRQLRVNSIIPPTVYTLVRIVKMRTVITEISMLSKPPSTTAWPAHSSCNTNHNPAQVCARAHLVHFM